jgi:hypothetical protein
LHDGLTVGSSSWLRGSNQPANRFSLVIMDDVTKEETEVFRLTKISKGKAASMLPEQIVGKVG